MPLKYHVRQAANAGFILVATLWVLAGLGLLAAYIDDLTDQNVQRAMLHKQNIQRELDELSTEATLVYLFATSRMNERALILEKKQHLFNGVGEVSVPARGDHELLLNDTVYRGLGDVYFSVQDEGGLVPVNSHQFPMFLSMLRSLGISDVAQRLFVARLQDYTDADQVLSLNGAEYFEYQKKNQPLPANGLMKTPLELSKILGFSELLTQEQWAKLRPYLTMRQVTGYNFNVIPENVLMGLFGNQQGVVQSIVSLREGERIRSVLQIEAATGRRFSLDGEDLRQFPSEAIRISLWQKNSRMRTLSGVEFTAFEESSAWRTDYHYSEQHHDAIFEQDSEPAQDAPTALL